MCSLSAGSSRGRLRQPVAALLDNLGRVLDTSVPNLARAYDYLLGGGANFAADRALAGRLTDLYPATAELLSISRTLRANSVGAVAAAGIELPAARPVCYARAASGDVDKPYQRSVVRHSKIWPPKPDPSASARMSPSAS